MGTYYRIDNHDKCESIDLCEVTNIKAGAYIVPRLQNAILNVFLGFSGNTRFDLNGWIGRWALNRIRIHSDHEDDAPSDDWVDAGMIFLEYLDNHCILEEWLESTGYESSTYVLKVMREKRQNKRG